MMKTVYRDGQAMIYKLITIVVLLSAIGCTQTLKVVWEANPVEDNISHYTVYVCETQDSTVGSLDSVGVVGHNPMLDTYQFVYTFQDTMYIQAGIIAVDSLTRRSEMATTRFYGFPEKIEQVEIKR